MAIDLKLSKMKKISVDKDHTTMATPEGHRIMIRHASLSKPHRKALESLPFAKAEGGKISDDEIIKDKESTDKYNKTHDQEPKEYSPAVQKRMRETDVTPKGMHFMASGGMAGHGYEPCLNPQCKSHGQPHPNCQCYAQGGEVNKDKGCKCCNIQIPKMAEGGQAGELIDYDKLIPLEQEANKPFTMGGDSVEQSKPESTAPTSPILNQESASIDQTPSQPIDQTPAITPPQPQEAQTPQASSIPTEQHTPSIVGGFNQQLEGINKAAQAEAKIADDKSKAIATNLLAQQEILNRTEAAHKATQAELAAIRHDIDNSHIDPNHYLGSMDTMSRIGTAIGLVLGGIGGRGHSNQALDFMNAQIDRDIAAQKAEIGKKESIYSGLLAQDDNDQRATNMTRLIMNDLIAQKLQQAEMQSTNALVKARAQQARGVLEAQMAPLYRTENAYKLAHLSGSKVGSTSEQQLVESIDAMRLGNPELAEVMEAKYVPGYSKLATRKVNDKIRESLVSRNQLDAVAKDLLKFSQEHTGSLDPRVRAQGIQKAQLLQSLYREGVLGTVYKAGEQPLLDKVVGEDPSSFFNHISNIPKLKEIIEANNRMKTIDEKHAGLQPSTSEKSQPEIKVVHGIKYMRGPNGEAIRVK